jgi:SAM-dependent methyltransferase
MGSLMLNVDQHPDELADLYRERYYWYLQSSQFRETFLRPLGDIINRLGCPCLDVGCGEGWLADYVSVPYVGFDGSTVAIRGARQAHPGKLFHHGRIERPTCYVPPYSSIVFGNLLQVLVKEECRVAFLESYLVFLPRYLIVYDLEILKTAPIRERFEVIEELHATADVPNLQDVKRHRQILVLRAE